MPGETKPSKRPKNKETPAGSRRPGSCDLPAWEGRPLDRYALRRRAFFRVAFFAVAFLRPRFLRPRFLAAIPGFPPYLVAPVSPGSSVANGYRTPGATDLKPIAPLRPFFLHAHRGTRATVAANRNTAISGSSRHNLKKNNVMEELVADTRTRTPRS